MVDAYPGIQMALNIKSDEAHRLAKELAREKGSTLTEAVTSALAESLTTARGQGGVTPTLIAEVVQIQRFVAELPDRDGRSPDEILGYDEQGLPD